VLFTIAGVLVENDIVAYMSHPVAVEISLIGILHGFYRMFVQMTIHTEDSVREAGDKRIIMGDQKNCSLSAQPFEQLMKLFVDYDIYI
jgi:hypothetical protein